MEDRRRLAGYSCRNERRLLFETSINKFFKRNEQACHRLAQVDRSLGVQESVGQIGTKLDVRGHCFHACQPKQHAASRGATITRNSAVTSCNGGAFTRAWQCYVGVIRPFRYMS